MFPANNNKVIDKGRAFQQLSTLPVMLMMMASSLNVGMSVAYQFLHTFSALAAASDAFVVHSGGGDATLLLLLLLCSVMADASAFCSSGVDRQRHQEQCIVVLFCRVIIMILNNITRALSSTTTVDMVSQHYSKGTWYIPQWIPATE